MMKKKTAGFTFIELMFALLILGIIIGLSVPSYNYTLIKARRLEAKTALLELATQLEDFYSDHHSYLGFTHSLSLKWYTLKINQLEDARFHLSAIPQKNQAEADKICQTLTFNYLGEKGISAGPLGFPEGSISDCW